MDVLSDVLRAIRLTGAVYFDLHARAPWAAEVAAVGEDHRAADAGVRAHCSPSISSSKGGAFSAAHRGAGDCRSGFEAGDAVVIVRRPERTRLSSDAEACAPRSPRLEMSTDYRREDQPLPYVLHRTRRRRGAEHGICCGFLGCDARPFNPVIDALPPLPAR